MYIIEILSPTVYVDNIKFILNMVNSASDLKKKILAMSYYFPRNHIACGVIEVGVIASEEHEQH